MALAERLKYERIKRGMTQEKFAKFLKVDRSSITHYESGNRIPSPATLKRISEKLKIDLAKELIKNEQREESIG